MLSVAHASSQLPAHTSHGLLNRVVAHLGASCGTVGPQVAGGLIGGLVTLNPIGAVVGAALGASAGVSADSIEQYIHNHDFPDDPFSFAAIQRLIKDDGDVSALAAC